MDQAEYERRKRELDRQEEVALELQRTAFRAQRNALDLVWLASPENRGRADLPLDPLLAVAAPPPLPPAEEPPPRRWRPGALRAAVEAALDRVPREFDRNDIVAFLGREPERGSLYRVLEDLRLEGEIDIVTHGRGRTTSRYRKLR